MGASKRYQVGQPRAARLMKIGWSTWLYKKKVRRFGAVLRRRLCEMAASHVRYGYRRLTVLLRREGWKVKRETHLPAVHRGAGRVLERGKVCFARRRSAETGEVPRTLPSRSVAQRIGRPYADSIRGAPQAHDRKNQHIDGGAKSA